MHATPSKSAKGAFGLQPGDLKWWPQPWLALQNPGSGGEQEQHSRSALRQQGGLQGHLTEAGYASKALFISV